MPRRRGPAIGRSDDIRRMANSAFDAVVDAEGNSGSDRMSTTSLSKLLKAAGMSGNAHSQTQAQPLVTSSGSVTRKKFIDWCVYQEAEGNGSRLNRLLLRYQVGATRNTSYDLPGSATVFGRPGANPDETVTAADAIATWVASKPSQSQENGVDIIYENKHANIAGCLTVKQANEWRAQYRKKKAVSDREKQKKIEAKAARAGGGSKDVVMMSAMRESQQQVETCTVGTMGSGPKEGWDRANVFGKVSKPSEPLGTLLSSEFAAQPDPAYADVSGQTKAGRLPKPRATNNFELLKKSSALKLAPKSKKGAWKMKKFGNAKAQYLNY
tara:strand:- start:105 stop:1082 length:978 start_codon:yes stop_codon:yes gene_type:complete